MGRHLSNYCVPLCRYLLPALEAKRLCNIQPHYLPLSTQAHKAQGCEARHQRRELAAIERRAPTLLELH